MSLWIFDVFMYNHAFSIYGAENISHITSHMTFSPNKKGMIIMKNIPHSQLPQQRGSYTV